MASALMHRQMALVRWLLEHGVPYMVEPACTGRVPADVGEDALERDRAGSHSGCLSSCSHTQFKISGAVPSTMAQCSMHLATWPSAATSSIIAPSRVGVVLVRLRAGRVWMGHKLIPLPPEHVHTPCCDRLAKNKGQVIGVVPAQVSDGFLDG